jgi:outer membrane protein assembly factor BamB
MPPEQAAEARETRDFFAAKWREYGEWRLATEALDRKVKDAGHDPKVLWFSVKQASMLGAPLRDEDKLAQSNLLQNAALRTEFERLKKWQDENYFLRQDGNNGSVIVATDNGLADGMRGRYSHAAPLIPKGKLLLKYDLWFADGWEGYTTWSFATPVTDGELVYVTTVNNAVAAVDMDGKIKWLVWETRADKGGSTEHRCLHTRFAASPILVGDKLVVHQNGHMRAYDKATGKRVWSVWDPYVKDVKARGKGKGPPRPTPEAVTPAWARLKLPDGGTMDVVVDGGHLVYRADDGAIVCTNLPMMHKAGTPIMAGDRYLWATGVDGRLPDEQAGIVRLRAESRDRVVAEEVWVLRPKDVPGATVDVEQSTIWHAEQWYGRFFRGVWAYDTLKPGEIHKFERGMSVNWSSPMLAGSWLVSFPRVNFWDNRGQPTGGVLAGQMMNTENGEMRSVARAFVDNRVFEDREFELRNRFIGTGEMISNASPAPQANRMFHRTKGYLWCIGNPAEPFLVPKGCPPHARVR